MANEVPWFVWEVPHAFVSLNFTTHLHDATMVKTFVNAYHNNEETIKHKVAKYLNDADKWIGRSFAMRCMRVDA